MENKAVHAAIERYINAYNNFDVEGMLTVLHPEIEFKNITAGEVTLCIQGLAAFKSQAETVLPFFSSRKQTITGVQNDDEQTEVLIAYNAILAIDLPNGLKAGQQLELNGKSIFKLNDDLIISIADIS